MFWPGTRSTSKSAKNRLTASQKSSRTMTMAWTRSPSHCRSALTSSVFSSCRLACNHCSNWSRTMKTFWLFAIPLPCRRGFNRPCQIQVARQFGTPLSKTFEQASLGPIGGCLDVNRMDTIGQLWQQPGLHQRRLAAAAWAVDQSHRERQFVRPPRFAVSRTGCFRVSRPRHEDRVTIPGKTWRRWHRTIGGPWGRRRSGEQAIGLRLLSWGTPAPVAEQVTARLRPAVQPPCTISGFP